MGTVLIPVLNGLVGKEPDVPPAPASAPGRPPARDVGLILIGHAERQAIQRDPPRATEMEDELVTVVDESRAVDGLVVPERQVPVHPRRRAGGVTVDGDGL